MEKPEKITKYIHAIQPGTICNLNCSYCYVPDLKKDGRVTPVKFNYHLERIAKAISQKRLGGIALITFVGGGETFLTQESVDLLRLFLEEGHIVNAVSNLTYTPMLEKIMQFPEDLRKRLQFSASFHYLELKKRNLIDTYFENMKKLEDAGICSYINLTICEEYIPYLEEINNLCLEKTGRHPFVLYGQDASKNWERYSFFTTEFINKIAKLYDCQHLILENENSVGIKRKEFCYMGDWGFIYNTETGMISACFDSPAEQNIIENIDKPINFEAVGVCCSKYCGMGARFLGLGVIPTLKQYPSYHQLFAKAKAPVGDVGKYTDNYLWETNKKYSWLKEQCIKLRRKISLSFRKHIK
jgi:hypothetical protein